MLQQDIQRMAAGMTVEEQSERCISCTSEERKRNLRDDAGILRL